MTPTTDQLKDLLAMVDAGYSGAYDHLAHLAPTLAAEVVRLRGALADIGRQNKTDELYTEYDVEVADFEAGYDACIDRARQALDATSKK